MRFGLLLLIGYAWGAFAGWYIVTPENLTVLNWLFIFIVIPGALAALFQQAERLLVQMLAKTK